MKTIIVPTDYSPVAINAMEYALGLAQSIGATITLLHVYQAPVLYNNSDIPLPLLDLDELAKINREKMDQLLDQAKEHAPATLVINTETRLGNLTDELNDICKALQPFAIVMGTKGAGFVERLLIGSSTLSAIRHLTTPVLVVPPGAKYMPIQQIGFATDLKKAVDAGPAKAIEDWVKTFEANLRIINVDEHHANVRDTAEQAVAMYHLFRDLNPTYHYIDNPEVETGLSAFAESNELNLLIVIPQKHRLLDLLFQKSHTRDLIFHSQIPILCIHEKK